MSHFSYKNIYDEAIIDLRTKREKNPEKSVIGYRPYILNPKKIWHMGI